MFASHIAGERERRLIKEPLLVVVVFDLNAIVRVIAHTARRVQRIFTQGVLIPVDRQPAIRPPEDLESDARPAVESSVGLPAVREPRLDLQVLRRKNLDANAVEKPGCVR